MRDADKKKDKFLAMLAHELRTPLAAISNAWDIATLPQAAEKDRQFAEQVLNRQLAKLVRIIDDLLDVSRIAHGKVQPQKERLEITASS